MADGGRLGMNQLGRQVIDLLEADLLKDGFDLLDVRVFQGGGRTQIRVYIDLIDGGIALGECARAARTAGMLLEEADIVPGRYVVEVSSPGIRRPLRKQHHYEAAVGQPVDLKVRILNTPSRLKGLLQAVDGTLLTVVSERGDEPDVVVTTDQVDIKQVLEGNLDPEFDAQAIINAERRERKESKRQERLARRKPKKSRPKKPKQAGGEEPDSNDTPSG